MSKNNHNNNVVSLQRGYRYRLYPTFWRTTYYAHNPLFPMPIKPLILWWVWIDKINLNIIKIK